MALAATSVSACFIPPDAVPEPVRPNTRPRIDLESLDPVGSLFEADEACACFLVRARVFDADDDTLQVRFATNVGRDNNRARCVIQDAYLTPRLGQLVDATIVPLQHLAGFPAEGVHTVSMYVTDAPGFLADFEDDERCGLIADEEGDQAPGVVEQRWTVRFVRGLGQCAGCDAPGS